MIMTIMKLMKWLSEMIMITVAVIRIILPCLTAISSAICITYINVMMIIMITVMMMMMIVTMMVMMMIVCDDNDNSHDDD